MQKFARSVLRFFTSSSLFESICLLLPQILQKMPTGPEHQRDYFYQVLELTREATSSEIKTQYKKLAVRFHPGTFSIILSPFLSFSARSIFYSLHSSHRPASDKNIDNPQEAEAKVIFFLFSAPCHFFFYSLNSSVKHMG